MDQFPRCSMRRTSPSRVKYLLEEPFERDVDRCVSVEAMYAMDSSKNKDVPQFLFEHGVPRSLDPCVGAITFNSNLAL